MRKLIVLLFLVVLSATGIAQDRSVAFFAPVPDNLFKTDTRGVRVIENASVWLIRPAISITAVQLNWNKVTKQFDASALNSAGLGIGYQHFIEIDGLPFNNYGINALLLLGANVTQTEPATVSIALTGSFLNFVNIGGLYNISQKTLGILTGVSLKF